MTTTTNESGARTSGVTRYSWPSTAIRDLPVCDKAMTEPCRLDITVRTHIGTTRFHRKAR